MITGHTSIIAHLGVPTGNFRAPMIYNPWFEHQGIDCVVIPMGCETADFPAFLPLLFRLRNMRGALITMPHKIAVVDLLDEASPAVRICGACNAVRRDADGRLIGDMFDGEGFVRGMRRNGHDPEGKSAMIAGAGGVGSAIAASLAAARIRHLALCDLRPEAAQALAARLRVAYPELGVTVGPADPRGHDIVVNATPLGMNHDDPLPFETARLDPGTYVGEVVMSRPMTRLLAAAQARGCPVQVGTDMLYEQIPAYLEFFGFEAADADTLRRLSRLTQ